MKRKLSPASHVTLIGLLGAAAMVLSWLENTLPPLPVAGARLGLANVAVTAALALLGAPSGAAVGGIKVAFAFLTRGATAALMACGGTLCAVFLTVLLLPLYRRERLTFVGVSVAASAAHSLGQLGAASLLLGGAVALSAPLLLLVSLPTGIVTGLLLNITVDRLRSVLSHI